jgi:hypothetical protein
MLSKELPMVGAPNQSAAGGPSRIESNLHAQQDVVLQNVVLIARVALEKP